MPRRKDHRSRAVNRVNTRGKNFDRFRASQIRHGEPHLGALRLPDPVPLHQDDPFGPFAVELF